MNKILEEIGVTSSNIPSNWHKGDKRETIWKKQQDENGFDDRDTWDLDLTLMQLIYPRLVRFYELANDNINLDFHIFEIDGLKFTLREVLLFVMEVFKEALQVNCNVIPFTPENEKKIDEKMEKAYRYLGIINRHLWW